MMIAELHITREGVERARSQAMVNTPSALRADAQRNLSDAVFIATAFILMARENQAGRMLAHYWGHVNVVCLGHGFRQGA